MTNLGNSRDSVTELSLPQNLLLGGDKSRPESSALLAIALASPRPSDLSTQELQERLHNQHTCILSPPVRRGVGVESGGQIGPNTAGTRA